MTEPARFFAVKSASPRTAARSFLPRPGSAAAATLKPNAVRIYGSSYCSPCKAAKEHFTGKGFSVSFVDIEKSDEGYEEMAAKLRSRGLNPGMIPVIETAENLVVGFAAPEPPPSPVRATSPTLPLRPVAPATEPVRRPPPAEVEKSVDWRYPAIAGAGILGGATIGYWAFDHSFGKGMTDDEKKQIAGFGLALGVVFLASQVSWGDWLTLDGIGGKIESLIEKAKV